MSILKVIDSFSYSETRLELAPSSLNFFQENIGLSKMYHTIYANTHFDSMDFEVEELIQKTKMSLKNQTSCFGQTKRNHFKKSQTYLPTNNLFIAKVTYKGYVRYISFLFLTSRKSSLFETEKISKSLLVLEIFKFKNFRILDFKTSSNT